MNGEVVILGDMGCGSSPQLLPLWLHFLSKPRGRYSWGRGGVGNKTTVSLMGHLRTPQVLL